MNRAIRVGTSSTLVLVGICLAAPALGQLTITPITWDVVGLDSNRPLTSGPELFPVGAQVCSATATTDVDVDFVWPDGNGSGWDFGTGDPYINLRSGSLTSLTFASIGAGECVDAYFELRVTRDAAAFEQSREYVINATDLSGTVSTPSSRAIRIERLVSQNRNTTLQIRYGQQADESDWLVFGGGGINLAIGETYFIELTTQTSTAYEELQSFLTLSNTIFQVKAVSTTYSTQTAPTSRVPDPNPRLWADGCLWESDTGSPNYNSCLSDGKAGGVVVTVYEIDIISGGGGSVALEALIYDRSGGSFHYNTDYSESPGELVPIDPAASDFSKRFLPATISPGGTSRLLFTITNPNDAELSGYTFTDTLPTGVEVAATPNASSSCGGTWNPAAAATVLNFDIDTGVIGANSSCSIGVDVTAAAEGSYDNVSENLFVDGVDTGNNATATLTVNSGPLPPPCVPGTELARWTMDPGQGTGAPPLFFSKHPDVSSAVASFTAGGTGVDSITTANGNPVNAWLGSGWGVATVPDNVGPQPNDASYFEFVVDSSAFSSNPAEPLTISLDVNPLVNGDWATANNITLNVHADADGGGFTTVINQNPVNKVTWTTVSTTTVTPGSSTTTFRVNISGRNGSKPDAALAIDNVIITGCGPGAPGSAPDPPTLDKAFLPNPIGAGEVSTLTFTLDNPNAGDALSGVSFDDTLPPGMTVAMPANASSTCGGTWTPAPGDGVLDFSGGAIPAASNCSLTVDVTSSTLGSSVNISDYIFATESGQNATPTGSASDTLVVLAPPSLEKDFAPDLVLLGVTPNDASTLTFSVTNPNPGNAISGVSFSDTFPAGLVVATPPNASTSGCGAPTWAPGAGAGSVSFSGGAIAAGGTCLVSVDVTGPEGVFDNVSDPVSHVVGGVTVTDGLTATATVVIDQPIPEIKLVKQVGLTNDPEGAWFDYLPVVAGTDVYYKLTVENIGETALADLGVTDPTVTLTCDPWPNPLPVADVGDPAPHVTTCIVGPFAATAGVVNNTATASADAGAVTDSDSATYATVALTLDKVASPLTYTAAGQVISYTFTVTNTGNAILASPVTINDPLVSGASCPSLTTIGNNDNFFDPTESIVCTGTYTIQPADVVAGSVMNTATASVGGFTTPSDSATVILLAPALSTSKVLTSNADGDGSTTVTEGDVLTYTVTVTNSGNVPLTGVVVTDNKITPTGGTTPCATVAIAGTCTLIGTYTVTAADVTAGSISNTGTGDSNETPPDDDVLVTPVAGTPALTTVKTLTANADGDSSTTVTEGDVLTYTVTVTNSGNVPLTNVVVTDNKITPTGGTTPCANVAIAGTCTLIGTYTVTAADVTAGSISNTGTGDSNETPPDDDVLVTPVAGTPALTTVKTLTANADGDGSTTVTEGDVLTYTVTVTNTGNVPLTGVVVTDNKITPTGGTTPCATVAIAGTCTLIGTYTVTAADVTAGSISNTGTGDSNETPPDDDVLVTPVAGTPALTTVKTLTANADGDSSTTVTEGDVLTYTVTVTNSGNVPLTGVVVTDNKITPTGGTTPCATVAIAGTCTLIGTYTVTAADVTAGSISNTGTGDSNETPPDDDVLVTPVAGTPALTTVKTLTANADGDSSTTVTEGDVLTYTVTVTNSGNVPLTGVVVTDNKITPTGGTTPCATVAIGGTCTLVGTYTVTAADVTAGSISNTGTGDSNETPPDDDVLVTPVAGTPALTTAKTLTANADGDSSTTVTEGDVLTYTVTVTNSGNVPLTGVVVTDNKITPTGGTTPCATVAIGGTCTLVGTYTVTAADVTAGSISNTGTGDSNETPPDDDVLVTPVAGTPALTTAKTLTANADGDSSTTVTEGDVLTYTVTVTNSGNVPLTGVVVTDNKITPTGGTTPCATVAIGGTCTLVGTYTVTAADVTAGSISNTGTGDSNETPPDDDVLVTPVAGTPALTTAKTLTANADGDSSTTVTEGDVLTYTVTVTNSGNVPLTGVVVTDNKITPTGGTTPCATVAIGGTCTLVGTYTVTAADVTAGSISNTGTGDSNETPPDNDVLITPVVGTPALSTSKALTSNADGDGSTTVTEGDVLTYTVTVTNTGNVPLTGVVVTDNKITPTGGTTPCATVAIGGTCTLVGTYTVTAADITAGSISNTGTGDSNETPPDDDVLDTPVVGTPELSTTKALTSNADGDGSTTVTEGDVLTYTVTVTNTGNVPLTNVVVTDNLITPTGGTTPCATIAIGGTCTLIGTYTVTAADIAAGSITNTGTGDSNETPPDDDVLVTPVVGTPALGTSKALTSNADGDGSTTVTEGDLLTYTVTVTNSGNVPLTNVIVTDNKITPTGGTTPCATVAIGGTCTLVGTYTVTAADVTAGSISNTGTGDSNETPPDDDVLVTPVDATPALSTSKALTSNADGDGSTTVTEGDILTYTVTVTNTGNVPLTGVVVTDNLITPTGGTTPCANVAIGGTCTLIGTYTVTAADVTTGSISNTGTGDSNETPPDDDVLVTPVDGSPALSTSKALTDNADGDGSTTVTEGDLLTYTVTVTNTGNVPLTNVVVADNLITPTGGTTPCATVPLAGTCTLIGTYTVTAADVTAGSISNTGTGDSTETPPDDDVLVTPVEGSPALNTSKALTGNADEDASGTVTEADTLTYTVTVTNTGNVPLTNVVVSDDLITPTGGTTPCATLAIGGTCTLIGTYVVTAGDITAGSITNTGTGDSDETPPDDDVLVTPIAVTPALQTSKALTGNADGDASGTVTEGDALTYVVTVTNTGNVALTNVVVTDSLITPTGGTTPCATVAIGGTCTLIGTYTVTAADVALGSITNTGTGDSNETPPDDDVVTTPVLSSPEVFLSKSSTPDSGTPVIPGDTITYTLTLQVVDGPTTAEVELTDMLGADLTFDSVTSNPGGFTIGGSGNLLIATLPAGASDGTYEVEYTATVNTDALGEVDNVVVITGGGGDSDPECDVCSTEHPPVGGPTTEIPTASTVGLFVLLTLLAGAALRRLRNDGLDPIG